MKGEIYVRLDQVSRKFGEEWALKEVSVQLERGKIYGIVGNNGSGKTVFMKCICGLLPATSGRIWVGGKEIGKEIDFPESLGVIIETPGFLSGLTGRKNLEILADLRKKIDRTGIEEAMRKVGLDPDMKKQVSKYSLGMRQRLGIAQAIMDAPDILILDEPFNSLDKDGVKEIAALLLSLKHQGKTMILASHHSDDIDLLCDEVYEMESGKISKQTGGSSK